MSMNVGLRAVRHLLAVKTGFDGQTVLSLLPVSALSTIPASRGVLPVGVGRVSKDSGTVAQMMSIEQTTVARTTPSANAATVRAVT